MGSRRSRQVGVVGGTSAGRFSAERQILRLPNRVVGVPNGLRAHQMMDKVSERADPEGSARAVGSSQVHL